MVKDKNIILDKAVSLEILKQKKIAIIGYGNQGRAQALNLKDSKLNIKIGLRKDSQSINKAQKDNLDVLLIENAVKWADLISILIPDKMIPSRSNS